MKIIEIKEKKEIKSFHDLPFQIYAGNKVWVPHVRQEVEAVFQEKKNKYFKDGEASRWNLYSNNNEHIGRIAAFIYYPRANSELYKTGACGFFECINDHQAAKLLFDTAKEWLASKGMEAMDGPINFGERNKYWGLLIDGFDKAPNYGNNYHLPYYKDLFQQYGFKEYFKQHCFIRPVDKELNKKYWDKAQEVLKQPDYSFQNMKQKPLMDYAEDFRQVYNKAWQTHHNFKEMSERQSKAILKSMKLVMDKEAAWFAYYKGKPAGFIIFLPELNEIFRSLRGNLNGINKLRFLLLRKFRAPKNLWAVVFGIHPDHQSKGLESAIFATLAKTFQGNTKYENVLISWIGDFNPKMLHIIRSVGAEDYQLLATYRYHFDPEIEVERCPIIQ